MLKPPWVPDRQEIIWISCTQQTETGMCDLYPFLVLSPRIFNDRTSLVIGLPMTTAAYNADNPFAVAVGTVHGKQQQKVSYILCHQPKSFNWCSRKATPHPLKRLSDHHFAEVCLRLNQIIQIG